jgi:hypothetical protein
LSDQSTGHISAGDHRDPSLSTEAQQALQAQPVAIGPAIVNARNPTRYMKKPGEPIDDLEADERVRQYFERMGLSAAYDKAHLSEEQS